MDHVVYLDFKSKELENLLNWKKSIIIRWWTWRKMPYNRVLKDDVLYFINNNAEKKIKAKAVVNSVYNSEKMTKEESISLVQKNQGKLLLWDKQFSRWAWKRYIILIEVKKIEEIWDFWIDRSNFWNMDDWLVVEKIENVKL